MANKYNIVVGVKLQTGDIQKQLDSFSKGSASFGKIAQGAKEASKHTMTFGQMLGEAYKKFAIWSVATVSWYSLVRGLKDAVQQVIALDTAFTRLKMVTQATDEQLAKMKDTYISLAREMKVGLSTITDAAETWLRTGMSAADATEALQASTVLSKDAFMEGADAASVLVAAQKAYRLEAEDLMGVVDKLTTLDTKAATTAKDLGEALALSGASASAAGFSMDKYLAILATSSEVTQQSSSVIGNAWKTLTARLRKVGAGASLDDEGEDISDVDKVLKNYGINLRDVTNGLSNMENVVQLLGERWQTYTAEQKAQIATAVAGTRQQNIFIATMENYDRVLELTEESLNSTGSAQEKFSAYQESVAAKIENLKTAWIGLADATINSDFVKWLIDAGTAMVDFAKDAGGLIPVITGLAGAIAMLKGGAVGGILGGTLLAGSVVYQIMKKNQSNWIEENVTKQNEATKELVKTQEKEANGVNELMKSYVSLVSLQEKTKEQTGELEDVTGRLAKAFGVEKKAIGESIDSYKTIMNLYQNFQLSNLENQITSLMNSSAELQVRISELQVAAQSAKNSLSSAGDWRQRQGSAGAYIYYLLEKIFNSGKMEAAQKQLEDYTNQIAGLQAQIIMTSEEGANLLSLIGETQGWDRSEEGANHLATVLKSINIILDSIKEKRDNADSATKEKLDNMLTAYEGFVNVIQAQYDTFVTSDFVLTEYYDKQLKALKEQKELEDELAKQKEEQQKIADAELKVQDALLDVEKKRAALAEAKEKRIQVFRMGRGLVYEEDTSAISSAQDDLSKSLENYQDAMENLAKVQGMQTEALIKAVENLQKAYGLALLGDEEQKARKFFQTKENLEWYKGLSQEEQLAALMQFMTPENQAKAQALWSLDEELINTVGERVRSGVFGTETGGANGAKEYLGGYSSGDGQQVAVEPTADRPSRRRETREVVRQIKEKNYSEILAYFVDEFSKWKEKLDKYNLLFGYSPFDDSSSMFNFIAEKNILWDDSMRGKALAIPESEREQFYKDVRSRVFGYHTGGIVGQPAFKSDTEMYAKLLKGEIVLPQNKFNNIIEKVKQSSSSQSTVLNIGNISLPNVDDADSFINELQKISYAKA